MVPVIEAACPAALMAGLGRPHRAPPPEPATAGRAVRVPAVTGGTDREEAIALPTGLLTEGLVHGGDARRTTADWTSCPNRGTTRTTGSVCRRARRSRGPGGPSGPSSSLPLRYPKQPGSGHNGGYGRRRPRGRKQPRPPGLAKPRRPRFHTAPTAVIYSGKQEPRTARDPAGASTIVQICALSSERQHRVHRTFSSAASALTRIDPRVASRKVDHGWPCQSGRVKGRACAYSGASAAWQVFGVVGAGRVQRTFASGCATVAPSVSGYSQSLRSAPPLTGR